jgi:hypothetical protein
VDVWITAGSHHAGAMVEQQVIVLVLAYDEIAIRVIPALAVYVVDLSAGR